MSSIATHVIAAMIGGSIAFAAYAIVAVSSRPACIVRCKHCRHSKIERHTGDDVLTCWVHKGYGYAVAPDHFCGYGEVEQCESR